MNASDISIAVNENQYQSPRSLYISICCDIDRGFGREVARAIAREESKVETPFEDAAEHTFTNRSNAAKYEQAKRAEAQSKSEIATTQSLLADVKARANVKAQGTEGKEGTAEDKEGTAGNKEGTAEDKEGTAEDKEGTADGKEATALERKLEEQKADHEIHVQKRRRVAVECAQAESKPVCASEALQRRETEHDSKCFHEKRHKFRIEYHQSTAERWLED